MRQSLLLGAAALSLTIACGPKAPPVTDIPAVMLPEVGPLPTWAPPTPAVVSLESGAELWVIEDHTLPLVSVDLVLPGGAIDDLPGKWGLASLTASMMEESAGGISSSEIAKSMKFLAANLSVSASSEVTQVSLDVSKNRLDLALPYMVNAIRSPDLLESDWERVQTLHVNGLKNGREEPAVVARELAYLEFLGGEHPLGHPIDGTPQMAGSITLEDIQTYHQSLATPVGTTIVIAGDVTVEEAKAAFNTAFEGWTGEARERPELPPVTVAESEGDGPKLFIVDMPGSSQTAFRVIGPGFEAGHPDEAAAKLAGIVIGGSFTSRLNNLLREQKGYTYGARASFGTWSKMGVLTASTNVRIDATPAALVDTLMILENAGAGFSEEEVGKAHAQYMTAVIGPMETQAGVASVFAGRAALGLGPTGWGETISSTLITDGAAMEVAAQRYINPKNLTIILAGDQSVIEGPLKDAGYDFQLTSPLP